MANLGETLEDGLTDLKNDMISGLVWEGVTVSVKQRRSSKSKIVLDNIGGIVKAGEILALMGPSGSGKTTLLNVLANRGLQTKSKVVGSVYTDRGPVDPREFRRLSAYVEQEDALIGSLTVRETLMFAARLSLSPTVSKRERSRRVDTLLDQFGLSKQADDLVGTPIRKGISGGQKRRLSVAAQLISAPKVLLLDEPTSGLDSAAAFEVVWHLKRTAQKYKLIVIASMHQPSAATFGMCDRLILLSQGQTAYDGKIGDLQAYFETCGYVIPLYMNPAEFALDFVNTDFEDEHKIEKQLKMVRSCWQKSVWARYTEDERANERADVRASGVVNEAGHECKEHPTSNPLAIVETLVHRSFIKSYRDIITYNIRLIMYLALATMMGTVWLRLEPSQENIQSFINAIFFGAAFLSFMAVAYIPAFLEDHVVYVREQADGLYGPAPFIVANFLVGLPYLFLISLLFSVITYWLSNFRSGASAFFTWTAWLFLDLIAAESLVVLIASLVPIFAVALAVTAFVNGLWMCTGGFLVPSQTLNPFWRYVFHYIDYQSYVFQGMMINEFGKRNYTCASAGNETCSCSYRGELEDQCLVGGSTVLQSYGYGADASGKLVGIMFAIIAVYRGLVWLVLYLRTR